VVATGNFDGVEVDTTLTSGGSTIFAVSNTTASNNRGYGVVQNGSAGLKGSVDTGNFTGNNNGVGAFGTSKMIVGRSVIIGNTTAGISNNTLNTLYTYGDNRISFNGFDIMGNVLSGPVSTQ
jgi:hypothetical protein